MLLPTWKCLSNIWLSGLVAEDGLECQVPLHCFSIIADTQQRFGDAGSLGFYRFIKVEAHFQREWESSHVCRLREAPTHFTIFVYTPMRWTLSETQFLLPQLPYTMHKGRVLFDLYMGHIWSDWFWAKYLICIGKMLYRGEIRNGWHSFLTRLFKVGEGTLQWHMARDF